MIIFLMEMWIGILVTAIGIEVSDQNHNVALDSRPPICHHSLQNKSLGRPTPSNRGLLVTVLLKTF